MEVEAFNRGEMRGPDGQTQRLPHGAIDSAILQRVLFTESLPAGVGGVGRNDANRDIREPITRIIQAAGNTRNPDNFIPTEDQINGMKGQIMGFNAPMAELRFSTTVRDAATGLDINSAQEIFTTFNVLIGVFEYLQQDDVALRRARSELAVQLEWGRTEDLDPAMDGAASTHMMMMYRHNRWVEQFAQNWLSDHIEAFENEIFKQEPDNAEEMMKTLSDLRSRIKDMTIPDD